MKHWWTLAEIAGRSPLPGLPGSKRALQQLADRESWRSSRRADGEPASRARRGKGGGTEYHVSLLPEVARAALSSNGSQPACTVAADLSVGSAEAADVRDARLAVLEAARAHRAVTGLTQNAADDAFCGDYNSGAVAVEPWVRTLVKSVSRRALYRWRAALKSGDAGRLASRQGRKKGSSPLVAANDGAVATYIGGLIIKLPMASAKYIRDAVEARFGASLDIGGAAVPLPGEGAFQRFVAQWKDEHKVALARITDPDGFRSKYRIAGTTRHAHVNKVNQVWQIDASPFDALCLPGPGDEKGGRNSIYVCADVFSRRMIILVSRTPRASAVNLLIRKAMLTWGVPSRIESDNGSDFKARAVAMLLAAMAIEHHRCDPYQPQQKGIVERAIGTVQGYMAAALPGYIGHDVGDRKRIEARRAFADRLGCDDMKAFAVELTAAELQSYLDRWARDQYGMRDVHSTLGMTPFAKAATCKARLKRVDNERALDVLLYEIAEGGGTRVVTKQGIRVDGQLYIAPTLMVGEKVLVRIDPADLGKILCFSPDGSRYLGEALCPEALGVDRAAAVAKARAEQKRMIDESTAAARAEARKIKPRDVIDSILRASAVEAGKLVEFPKGRDVHETPAMTAAAEAVAERPLPEIKLTAEQKRLHDELVAETSGASRGTHASGMTAATASNVVALPETAKQRFRRAVDLERREQQGQAIGEADAHWLGAYQTTPEYRAHKGMLDDFGEPWLAGGA